MPCRLWYKTGMTNQELYDKQKLVVENLQAKVLDSTWEDKDHIDIFARRSAIKSSAWSC